MDISAKIKGIKYKPLLCRELEIFDFKNLEKALSSCASFILKINKENQIAIKLVGFCKTHSLLSLCKSLRYFGFFRKENNNNSGC